jgi:hypothetical protein
MSSFTHPMLAHQGGWDEILLVAGPILIIAFLLRLAKRRVDQAAAAAEADLGLDPETGGIDIANASDALDEDPIERGSDTA